MTAYTVTATATNNTFTGLFLKVYVLDFAALAGSPAVASATAAFNASLTTTQAGSRVFGALDNITGATTFTASAGCTVTDQGSHNAGGAQAGSFYTTSPTGTPGPTTVGSSTTFPGTYGMAALEVLASGGTLAVETVGTPGGPAAYVSQTATTYTTPSFTPGANATLLVAVLVDGGGGAVNAATVSSSPSLPSWTEQVKVNSQVGGFYSYAGVWTAVLPPAAFPAASADAAGAAPDATGAAGAATAALYAGTAAGITGSWANTGNATGSTQGTYATWTDSAAGSTAVLELAGFNAQAAVPPGSAVTQVNCTVRHGEAPASAVASVTAQAYSGTTPVGSPQPLTAADAVHDDPVTFTGLAWADLADLRVRVTATRN